MKTKLLTNLMTLLTVLAGIANLHAQGTAFTYQGRLNNNGTLANGAFDFQFALADGPVSPPDGRTFTTNNAVAVSNGLFVVTLDFGSMSGQPYWLDIAVRAAGQTNPFVALSPRQQLTAAPYANYATRAGSYDGDIADFQLSANIANFGPTRTFLSTVNFNPEGHPPGPPFTVGNSILITNLNADLLDGLDAFSFWKIEGNEGTTAGAHFVGTRDNQPLELKVNNQRGLRLEPTANTDTVNVIGGSVLNSAEAVGATIGGGGSGNYFGFAYTNRVEADFGTVSGGRQNTILFFANSATIGGGYLNTIRDNANTATIGGGNANTIESTANSATIGGGAQNTIWNFAHYSTIGGGSLNSIQTAVAGTIGGGIVNSIQSSAYCSTIGGGNGNTIQSFAQYATIPGGLQNSATDYAFAAGRRAKANHSGAFVWADSTDADFASTANNQFAIRASGGVVLSGSTPNLSFGSTTRQMLNLWDTRYGIGVQSYTVYFRTDDAFPGGGFAWYQGGTHNDGKNNSGGGITMMTLDNSSLTVNGTFVSASDRNVKQDFAEVNSRAVLEKVAQLPIQTWAYKSDPHTKHLGPVAQDFYAAFAVGPDDKHITTVDESGVALAAIQGLNQKVDSETATLRAENAELKQRLEKLEQLMNQKNGGVR